MAEVNGKRQGSVIPTMFIGLGGVGSRIVDRIAQRAATLDDWETKLRPLTSFISIDTNELDQHKLRYIPDGNRINIAAFDKTRVIEGFRQSEEQQALQWLDRGYEPRPGFKPGAGQIRVESRLGFYYHSPTIRQRLKELVAASLAPGNTWRQSTPPKFNIYLFCTLAGGTGSGSFLSAAYLVDAVIRERQWQPRVIGNLLLSTLMLDKVGPELHADIHANAYAALKEIEHLNKLDYDQVKRGGRRAEPYPYLRDDTTRLATSEEDVTMVHGRPFFLSFLFDRPAHINLPDVEAAIGDGAYLQTFTPLIDNLASELDNYEKNLESLTRFPGELRDVGLGYSKNFGAFGAVVMHLPARDLLEYCALRFAAEGIRSLITFGIDPRAPDNDRARALARLAVNYSDPRFLRLSEQSREREINQAFITSVQELARQDEKEELPDGIWAQMVQDIDDGRISGRDENGDPVRLPSTIDRVETALQESRRTLMNRVSISQRAFNYPAEAVSQYADYIDRLKEDVRAARAAVDEGLRGLLMEAEEGEPIARLQLDPVAERFLVLRLLERLTTRWLPQREQELKAAQQRDIGNPAVLDRLERELFDKQKAEAQKRSIFSKDQAFLEARDEAYEGYRRAASAAPKVLDAEVALRQLRALQAYLDTRARQYARLATRMDALVSELEREAERYRSGEAVIEPRYALSIEVLQTLEEPRTRLWDRAYHHLFVDGAAYLGTFDRKTLSQTIASALKPEVDAEGRVREKGIDRLVADLRRRLVELGRSRLAPRIVGDETGPGLDLMRGLELEARLQLGRGKDPDDTIEDGEVSEYERQKFLALAQLAGVFARVSSAEASAFDDGVKVNRTRQLILGHQAGGDSSAQEAFVRRVTDVLSAGGRQVKVDRWHEPRLMIVHDVESPIPAYYFDPVVNEMEAAYLRTAADERRSYNLHTAYKWEKALPNLNPRKSRVTVGWALLKLAEGLVSGVIRRDGGDWLWQTPGTGRQQLGRNLSTALYRLGEYHRKPNLVQILEEAVTARFRELGEDTVRERRGQLRDVVQNYLVGIELREDQGRTTPDDALDKPIFATVKALLEREFEPRTAPSAAADPFESLGF
jgi:hypothetical protein